MKVLIYHLIKKIFRWIFRYSVLMISSSLDSCTFSFSLSSSELLVSSTRNALKQHSRHLYSSSRHLGQSSRWPSLFFFQNPLVHLLLLFRLKGERENHPDGTYSSQHGAGPSSSTISRNSTLSLIDGPTKWLETV